MASAGGGAYAKIETMPQEDDANTEKTAVEEEADAEASERVPFSVTVTPLKNPSHRRLWLLTLILALALALALILTLIFIAFVGRAKTCRSQNPDNLVLLSAVCNSTRYPDLCAQSLSSFPDLASRGPAGVVSMALSRAVDAVDQTREAARNLSRGIAGLVEGGDALNGCIEILDYSLDCLAQATREINENASEINESAIEANANASGMNKSTTAGLERSLSAALVDQTACWDGFEEAGKGHAPQNLLQVATLSHRSISIARSLISHISSWGSLVVAARLPISDSLPPCN